MVDKDYTITATDIGYNGKEYRGHEETLRMVKRTIAKLPEDQRDLVLGLARTIVCNVQGASHAIYDPLVDSDKLRTVNATANDYKTDLEALGKLEDIFQND